MRYSTKVSSKSAKDIVARISGVNAGESKVAAAEKVIETMRMAGMSTREAEKILTELKRREAASK